MSRRGVVETVLIDAASKRTGVQLGEILEFRGLLYFFVWRDIRVRYKQTILGAAWAILQPLFTAAIFSILFGRMAGIPSAGVSYLPFAYVGLLPWTYFSQAVGQSANSLTSSANLVTKVYFPRLLIPMAPMIAGLIDLLIASAVGVVLAVFTGILPTYRLCVLPLAMGLALGVATGVGVLLSALNVEYRDVRFVVPFLLQTWLFVTPVIYPTDRAIEFLARYHLGSWVVALNPMAGVVEVFRWCFLGTSASWEVVIQSVLASVVVITVGIVYFRRMERSFADVV